jgi:dihydroorotase
VTNEVDPECVSAKKNAARHDLVLRGARVIDPSRGIDAALDVAFSEGRVAEVAQRIEGEAANIRDVSGLILAPGFIDLHAHVYWGATSISVKPELVAQRGGVTTVVDAGSAGPGNFPGLRYHIIERSSLRILAFLNVSFPGIFAYSAPVMVGECGDLRLIDLDECIRVVNENRDLIVGIKVRVGRIAGGSNGITPLDMALEVAEETGLPVMAHVDYMPPSRKEVLTRLRRGDILTHCFKPFPNAPLRSDGEIWEEVLMARERGVIFDLGHGAGSLDFRIAKGMLAKGFVPDVLSTDLHVLNVEGPVFDLMTTLSKFHVMGLSLPDIVRSVTSAPAAAIRRTQIGTLSPGALGDATLFAVEEGAFEFRDCVGKTMQSSTRLVPRGSVFAGEWRS